MNLGAVTTLIFDLDGVVWRGDSPIESAIAAINTLRAAGKRCLFCTNNSSQTQAAFTAKLQGMSIEGVKEDEVITSSSATALYLSAQYTGPFLAYVVGGEGVRLSLQRIGARIVPDSDITEGSNVDCVIVGIDREFDYAKLDNAQRLIRRGALFVATNRDATYPVEDGVIPGAGAIVSAVETASGVTPVTVGKPRPVMLQLVMQQFNLKPEEIAFVGDRLDTDVVCARRAGVAALLVTTGVTTLQQARRAKGELRPDAVFPELTSFADVVLNNSPAPELGDDNLPTWNESQAASAGTAVTPAPGDEAPAVESPEAEILDSEVPQPNIPEAVETFVVPESTPQLDEVAAEVPPEAAEADAPRDDWPGFDMDTAMARDGAQDDEVPFTISTETEPTAEAETAPTDAQTPEWDDTWFSEDEQFEGDAQKAVPETAGEPASEESEKKREEGTAKPEATDFDWKLD